MIPKYLSVMWAAIAPALGNHLWQSTLFAVTAGLLTLILRKNHARARYCLWLAASVKFLIPFSLLVGIGSHLAWSRGSAGTKGGLYFAMEEISQPFTQPTMPGISLVTPSIAFPSLIHLLPALVAVWLCGFLVVFFVWYARWRRIPAAIREAVPLREGREVEALRRLERIGGIRKRIEMLLSRASLEPGIFGIVRPVLVWPEGVSERLEDAHLEAILAHEVWHVRRRDNLAAAIHMVVEAIFWFHPLVWWLGARLVEERERACDEEVVEMGSDRQVYAESILKVCEFCLGSPLACVAGVTGADLKKRIVHIMTERVARKLDFSRQLLLSAAGLVAVAAPIILGLTNATQSRAQSQAESAAGVTPVFEVASIKPNTSGSDMVKILVRPDEFTAANFTLRMLIREAYGVQDNQILDGPNWLITEKYDIEAKAKNSAVDEPVQLSEDQRRLEPGRMLRALLADRFKLTLHRETKELSVYTMVIANDGPKLHPSKVGGPGNMEIGRGQVIGQGVPVAALASYLSRLLGRNVLDKTELKGNYYFTLQWPTIGKTSLFEKETVDGQSGTNSESSPEASDPSIFTAIQEQLGLKLESQKGLVEILVIDHVEKPSGN
jgi:bla regulator protein BlaR1